MNDRELLTLAAKAAGYSFVSEHPERTGIYVSTAVDGTFYWQPHLDDGDSFRLASKCQLTVDVNLCFVDAVWYDMVKSETHEINEDWGAGEVNDAVKMRYVRRAVLRAAAEIGRAMK